MLILSHYLVIAVQLNESPLHQISFVSKHPTNTLHSRLCFSLIAFWALLSLCVWRATELWHLWKHGAYCLEFNSRKILNSGMFLPRLISRRYFSEWYWHSKFQTLILFQEQTFCCETKVYNLFIFYSDYSPVYSKCHWDESEPLICFQIFLKYHLQNFCTEQSWNTQEVREYPTCRMISSWFSAAKRELSIPHTVGLIEVEGSKLKIQNAICVPFVLKWMLWLFAGEIVSWMW